MGYHPCSIGFLTSRREPAVGQCQTGSLTGAVATERVSEAPKGSLRMDGNHPKSAKAEGSLTVHCCLKRSWKDSCSYFCCCYGIMRISYHLDIYNIRLFPYHPVALHPICILLGNHCNCGEYIFLPCLPPYNDR